MTRDYEAVGEFRRASAAFDRLDAEADEVLTLAVPKEFQGELGLRKIHHKRQRAEMHRLLGEYGTALGLMEEAIREYPEWAEEPRRFGQLHRADSLRLLGRSEEAVTEYERLEVIARNRHLDGFLAAVLWPKVGACQGLKGKTRDREVSRALGELCSLVDGDGECSRYSFIYSRLVRVPAEIRDVGLARRLVDEALRAGPLEPDCFRTEYAHALLCRAEIERGLGDVEQAEAAFRDALRYYEMMEMRWGIVRSTVGLNLVGWREDLPDGLGIEGCDEAIWARFKGGGRFAAGSLCENLP
jgi:tetratricopeptide (TPR) repeat protein